MKILFFSSAFLFGTLFVLPAHALTVNTFDCSGIDTQDGHVQDWEDIEYMINSDESVAGTTYYLTEDLEWTTEEPAEYRYSANLAQQANIQQMKVCNTDTFLMMLKTEEPMMHFYDHENDTYADFWSQVEVGEDEFAYLTLPADYHYWMVWKMQKADGTGAITYMAADLRMDEGRDLGMEQTEDTRIPQLYLYEESSDASYDEAEFSPSDDTQLVEIALSEDEQVCTSEDMSPDGFCDQASDDIEKENYAFEVSQNIAELFEYADFAYGDTINMTASMYNSDDDFETASGSYQLTVVDETETETYTFSKRAVRGVVVDEEYITDHSAKVTWKSIKNAKSYTIKLINANNGKLIRTITDIEKISHTLKSLQADKVYRIVVRAALPKVDGEKQNSAWSSGVRFVTDATEQ